MQSELKQLIADFKTFIAQNHLPDEPLFGLSLKPQLKAALPNVPKPVVFTPPLAPPKRAAPIVEALPPPPPQTVESPEEEKPQALSKESFAPGPILQAGAAPASFQQWRSLLLKIAPTLRLYQEPVDDREARRVKESYKERSLAPVVALLVSASLKRYRPFLHNLAQAISCAKAPCRLVDIAPLEEENKWENFLSAKQMRLIICPDQLLFTLPHLMTHYKELPQKRERTLGNTPLLLLPDLSIYTKDPMLKRSLWTLLCQTLDS